MLPEPSLVADPLCIALGDSADRRDEGELLRTSAQRELDQLQGAVAVRGLQPGVVIDVVDIGPAMDDVRAIVQDALMVQLA